MTPVSVWLLLAVVWQGGLDPAVNIYPQETQAKCERSAASFSAAEEMLNSQMPPTEADRYDTACVQMNWGDTEAA